MEKNSWSVPVWPNQESSYGEKLLGSCQYDQTKSKDWASIGKSTNLRSKGIRREPWISPSCSTPPSLPLLTYVCGGFFLQQCMRSSSRTRENEQSNPLYAWEPAINRDGACSAAAGGVCAHVHVHWSWDRGMVGECWLFFSICLIANWPATSLTHLLMCVIGRWMWLRMHTYVDIFKVG